MRRDEQDEVALVLEERAPRLPLLPPLTRSWLKVSDGTSWFISSSSSPSRLRVPRSMAIPHWIPGK